MKKTFWKSDWFAGVVISLLFLFAGGTALLQSLERIAYDLGVKASSRNPGDKIAIIAIDDQSISNIGRWPWSRDVHAKMTDMLTTAHAKVIGNSVFFIEPQLDPGLAYINKLSDYVTNTPSFAALPETTELDALIKDAKTALDADAKLAESFKNATDVVVAMPFVVGEPRGNPDKPLPDYVLKNSLSKIIDKVGAEESGMLPIPTIAAFSPIPQVGESAAAIGHLNASPDVDGAIRSEPLVLAYYDQYYPALSLQIAAKYLNLTVKDIQVRLGEGVKLGKLNITTDSFLQMNTFFYADHDGHAAFPVDSFYDVYSGKIPLEKYRDRIVLIGATAAGVGDSQVTPISANMRPIEILAHSVASILNEDFFVAPAWAFWVEKAAWLLIALYLTVLLHKLKAGTAAAITIGLFVTLVAAHFVLMTQYGLWLQLMIPATLLVVGHALLTTKRFLMTEKGKARSEAESAESNRNLALMFQSQGQLDMAFDRLRKCPMDDSVMDVLYNLALDFERKRQFNKAESVFAYMADFNPKYKDLEQRLARSRAMAETVILGGSGSVRSNSSTMILEDGSVEKPMLGRYQVEKELGKGAMGVVYLGKDPKIGRVVAIKTMALAQEFEPDELEEVKERFFREAETAGRLNHPNIVTMYDAGEEHDLAFIAMEFLKGKDLAPYTKPDNLLPLEKVLDIVAKTADALDYAHKESVVHRDIKPANIMYEPETGSVKVTDFGIARITDSSKTKTGMVLGTPSYMSPEQLAGKKVDGRSDLFSLGVMLYQMTTGQLPFTGDSMASLMFKIANEEHEPIRTVNANLPEALSAIIDRMLEKDIDKRYARGSEIAADIRQAMSQAG
ncbi:serine/threonine protein kinase [Methylovorus sp. MM2]|uniref:CHASE2 domain-containing serine/threonine-protein kinase n=1 Tax=Methylovorus sp. MM2 TaxID=1848038 RepID=UPI0007E16628|nr:serine/threonine-protein kinase [Methylovorus sp. MM2]OAM51552.1 serine/threonine protein kinase [Methylovorus sp. MM2]